MKGLLIALMIVAGTAHAGDADRVALMKKTRSVEERWALCHKATVPPRLGMTVEDIDATTWCLPWDRPQVTTTARGTTVVQKHCLERISEYNPDCRRFGRLYFENGVLTMISEN